ncbi:MAG TPA: DUF4157 domain-containing protein [Allosphingosinicella sp.]|jgi:hypothetical protein
MPARVIQGFFIGGAMRPQPAPRLAAAEGRPRQPTGAPSPAFAGRTAPLQARLAPGRPPLAHQGAGHVAQPHGGNGSFEIDPAQLGLARGGGKPLPQAVLAKMEAAFEADFSAVRVHVGPQASRIGAIAFTTGDDLYFAPGKFQPDTVPGRQLIGHELAHVVQQRQGRVRSPASGVAVVHDPALEAEADRLGMRAAMPAPPIQAKVAAGTAGLGRRGAALQAMYGNSAPANFGNYTVTTWQQHQQAVKNGADQIGLPLYALNPNPVAKAQAQTLVIPTVDISNRNDSDHMEVSVENIEAQTWKLTRQMQTRAGNGQSVSSHLAKQTEVVGETAALNAFAKKYPKYEMAFGTDPGHGSGIDQLWIERNPNGTVHSYMVVEAKGPNQALCKNQMSLNWVTSRINSLTNCSDAFVANVAIAVQTALAGGGNGVAVPYVDGCVITAIFRDHKGKLEYSVSKSSRYN